MDSYGALDQLLERLTESNGSLESEVSRLRLTVQDLEVEREVAEDLDASQRQELDALRRQADKQEARSV